jgi:hypothetical protein
MTKPRSAFKRAAHARHLLESEIDAWVASASASGDAHLIPLSFLWDGASMVLSTPVRSRTARDLLRAGRGRAALPNTRDVVILDGPIERIDPDVEATVIQAFADRHQWDPRLESTEYVFIRLIPASIQAWSVDSELATRVVMSDGEWADRTMGEPGLE